MKGITNAPLVIDVEEEWYSRPEILALMRQGHAVRKIVTGDLTLTRSAGWTEDLFDYLPAALTRARARRKKTK